MLSIRLRSLNGHGNEAGFLQKLSPLHYLSGRFDFGFEFSEIFIFEKLPPLSPIRGVADSPYRWYGESPTPRITDRESRLLVFLKKLSVLMIRGVVDSPHQWYGESATPRIIESESRRLRVSPIWRVNDSAYPWVGESTNPRIGNTGKRYSKKKLV